MDLAIANTLAQKRDLDVLVASRKGKKRSELPEFHRTRNGMLATFTAEYAASRKKMIGTIQAVIPEAYAPCEIPLATLEKMYIRDLLLESPHRRSFLVVRVFAHVFEVSSMQVAAAVEDEIGGVEQLSVYHFGFAGWPDKELRAGMVLAVKNPYLRSVITNRGVTLSVFHPSDAMILDEDHSLFPTKWKNSKVNVSKTGVQWKADGNAALQEKKFHRANYCYGKGLSTSDLDDDLKRDLHRNRAHVELVLGQYDAAKADALTSLLNKSDTKSKDLDCKAFFRAGRAMYELSNYVEAKDMFQKALVLSPSDKDAQSQLKRTITRVNEQTHGLFDFAAISREMASTGNFRADKADYLSRTDVRPTPLHGKGLFATEAIACGDLVLCERPLAAADKPKSNNSQNFVVSPNSKHVFWGGHAETWFFAVQKVYNNPSLADHLLDLSVSGKCVDEVARTGPTPIVDGVPVINVFRVLDILENNGFGFMAAPDQKQVYPNIPRPQLGAFYDCLGVWERASYANHSCLCNAERSFLGDLMVVRANKDIAEGAEITISYVPADGKYEEFKMAIRNYGFKCSCKLCAAENAYDGTRSFLLGPASSFEEAEPPIAITEKFIPPLDKRTVPAEHLIDQVKLYIERISDSYPEELFSELPRFGLIKRHGWLMKANAILNRGAGCMYAQIVLRDHGFKAIVEKVGVKIDYDRSNIIMTTEVVDAFAYLCFYYETVRSMALSRCMKKLALENYIILNGSDVGFKLMYEV